MKNRLAGVSACVDHHSVPAMGDALILGKTLGHEEELSHYQGILLIQLPHGGNMLPGDDEYMTGSLWVDIPKGQHILI